MVTVHSNKPYVYKHLHEYILSLSPKHELDQLLIYDVPLIVKKLNQLIQPRIHLCGDPFYDTEWAKGNMSYGSSKYYGFHTNWSKFLYKMIRRSRIQPFEAIAYRLDAFNQNEPEQHQCYNPVWVVDVVVNLPILRVNYCLMQQLQHTEYSCLSAEKWLSLKMPDPDPTADQEAIYPGVVMPILYSFWFQWRVMHQLHDLLFDFLLIPEILDAVVLCTCMDFPIRPH